MTTIPTTPCGQPLAFWLRTTAITDPASSTGPSPDPSAGAVGRCRRSMRGRAMSDTVHPGPGGQRRLGLTLACPISQWNALEVALAGAPVEQQGAKVAGARRIVSSARVMEASLPGPVPVGRPESDAGRGTVGPGGGGRPGGTLTGGRGVEMVLRRPVLRRGALLVATLFIAATVAGGTTLGAGRSAVGSAPTPGGAGLAPHRPTAFVHSTARQADWVDTRHPHAGPRSGPAPQRHVLLKAPTPASAGHGPRVVTPVPPDPVEATTTTLPASVGSAGWAGLSETSGPDTGVDPPDPWVAVGPEQVVQVTNVSMRITDRQGAGPTATTLKDFFLLPLGVEDSDPRVVFDATHGRWIATEVSWDCVPGGGATFGHGYLDFAISRTAEATINPNDWIQFFFYFDDVLPDYPGLGTSTDKLALGSNIFSMVSGPDCVGGSFLGSDYLFVDWADALVNGGSNGVVDGRDFFDPDYYTPRPAVQAPATSATMFSVIAAATTTGWEPTVLVWTGTVGAGTIQPGAEHPLATEGLAAEFSDPPDPQQPGPATVTSDIDLRPTDALWHDGRLVWVANAGCTPTGDSTARDCVRVTDVDTSAMTVATAPSVNQDFLVASVGQDDYMGGIGLAGNGTLHMVWTQSGTGAGQAPSSVTSYQPVGSAPNTIGDVEVIVDSDTAYGGTRWGDYVGVSQDPQVPNQVWQGNEYSAPDGTWATRVSPLQTGGTTYVPITPVRVLDTRSGTGLSGAFSSNKARTWQVTNGSSIPNGAVAVTGNLTVTGQQSAGYVSVTVSPTSSPPSSTINFPLGQTRANNLTIPLSSAGELSAVFKGGSGKKTHLVFDVTGYFLADDSGATFTPLAAPIRILDTRPGTGLAGKFVANAPRTLLVGDDVSVPSTAVAITGNLTVAGPTKAGYASVTKDPTASPTTSTINFPAGVNRANGVFAPLNAGHQLSIVYKSGGGGRADIILDVTGYFEDGTGGLRFVPLNPSRVMDTRSAAVLSGLSGRFTASTPRTLDVDGHWGVPPGAAAVTGNLTVTGQTAAGYVSVTPDPTASPSTSTINFPIGETMANGLVAPLNGSGNDSLVYKAGAGKKTHLILDLSGYFE
jgi:hypothetical protein